MRGDTVMIVEIVSKPRCVSGHARLSHQWRRIRYRSRLAPRKRTSERSRESPLWGQNATCAHRL